MKYFPALLSALCPGLGQIYLGEFSAGLALLIATVGLFAVYQFDSSWLTTLCLILGYLSLAYQSAKDAHHKTRNTETVQYILGLAVVIGPFCLPLLWQNKQIHLRGRLIWSAVVLVLSLLAILSLKYLGI